MSPKGFSRLCPRPLANPSRVIDISSVAQGLAAPLESPYMRDATEGNWNPDPLPRGRHRLSADVVRASQRERLLRAMLALVSEQGYQATSVPDVVTRARVSRSSFYQDFEGKLDCFLALCDEYSRGMIDEVLEAAGDFGDRPWQEVISGGMDAYLRWWRDRPEFARAFLVELPAAGTEGLEHRIDLLRPFEDLFAGLGCYMRAKDRSLAPLPRLAPRAVVRGTTELIAEEVRRGRVGTLPDLTGDLVDVISVGLGAAPVPSRR